MEQNPDFIAILVGWVAEELVAIAVGSVIGAIGAKWFFGKKNTEQLGRLRREVDELKRELNRQASSSSPASAPVLRDDGSMDRPAKSLKPPAAKPAPRDDDSKNRSPLPGSNVRDALLSPEELIALIKGHTGIMADRLLQPHKGRRHYIQGAIRDVSDYGSDGVHVTLEEKGGMRFVLWFDQDRQTETLETLRPGDRVSAAGLLRYASNHIALEQCTLEKVDIKGA